jgi:hypothetical protein
VPVPYPYRHVSSLIGRGFSQCRRAVSPALLSLVRCCGRGTRTKVCE